MVKAVKIRGNIIAPYLLLFIGTTALLDAQGTYAKHRAQGTYFQFPTLLSYRSSIGETENTLYQNPYLLISSTGSTKDPLLLETFSPLRLINP